jgi:GMP synthase (glutamine-hydrolysing)
LIILHQEASTPGRVGQSLIRRGFAMDIRRPRFGDPLPATLADHAGAIIFGGPMSANDEEDFIRREIDWLAVPLREQKPYLGICLGAQLLVRHLGGRVERDPDGRVEAGYYPLRATEAGRALLNWPSHVYQFHREGFDVPSCGTLLAEGDSFKNQAFSVGSMAFGIQFHPELTLAMMHRWTVKGERVLDLPGAKGRPQHFEGRALYDAETLGWLEGLLDRMLVPTTASATPQPPPQPHNRLRGNDLRRGPADLRTARPDNGSTGGLGG